MNTPAAALKRILEAFARRRFAETKGLWAPRLGIADLLDRLLNA